MYLIHFKFVGIKGMHNTYMYYLGLSGERSLPFGLLVKKLGMLHWGLLLTIVCSNDDAGLTLIYFTAGSNFVT